MQLYQIELQSLPRLQFAHVFETANYAISFTPQTNLLEISYIETGDIQVSREGGPPVTFTAPGLIAHFHRHSCRFSSRAALHRHTTIGIGAAYTCRPVSPSDLRALLHHSPAAGPLYAILPDFLPDGGNLAEVSRLLRQIVRASAEGEIGGCAQSLGLFMQLLAAISRECHRRLIEEQEKAVSPGSTRYCRQAMTYISAHLYEPVSIDALAAHVGISAGYLSNLFKAYTGRTLLDYITTMKMNQIRELFVDKQYTLREAGAMLGYEDEHYVSRLFKKQFGVSARAYRRLIGGGPEPPR